MKIDIFLERRADHDIARNALVGIFLRLLEYHQGIAKNSFFFLLLLLLLALLCSSLALFCLFFF